MNIDGIVEYRNINYIAYTFLDNSYFYETGYKVLRASQDIGLIKCNSFSFNGRMSLLYNIENKNTLSSIARMISPNAFANLVINIIDAIFVIKNNGFIHIESVDFELNNIYIDTSDLKPYFIYLPINIQSTADGFFTMESYLRQNLIYIMQNNSNLNSDLITRILYEMSDYSKNLSEIKNNILMMMQISTADKDLIANEINESSIEWNMPSYVDKQSGKLKRNRNEKKKNKITEAEYNGTTVLKENFTPSIVLVGVNTPQVINMFIDKSDFVIGHKEDIVDGYISFNSSVSRTHCKIKNINGKNYIIDLNSANGTWLNGKRINSGTELEIAPGDKIRVSNVEFLVSAASKNRGKING